MEYHHEQVAKVALQFAKNLHEALGPATMRKIVWENRTLGLEQDTVCATGDHCDSNVYMGEAFEKVMGRETDAASDDDMTLWNDAWNAAKRAEFDVVALERKVVQS